MSYKIFILLLVLLNERFKQAIEKVNKNEKILKSFKKNLQTKKVTSIILKQLKRKATQKAF